MGELFELVIAGGPVVAILLLCSILATAISLLKSWQLWLMRARPHANAERALHHLRQNERNQAALMLNNSQNPRAQLVKQTIGLLDKTSLTIDEVRNESMRIARVSMAKLTSFLRPLEVIAATAPLLGLLGTVLGMIEAFRAMESAGAQVNPAILSGGIWQALLTTAVGLAVAIPTSIVHSWFERRAEREAAAMQDALDQVFTLEAARRDLGESKKIA
ncbi:biopolymer transporter ExbB [Arenicella chitinivorans]|uniref:Biopolymer transporter ExbB n=1 Tax=Arenicella chitinivorans TaxID=1329800 RepID=A0A918RK85_9GAMM|nr:MotA/TolQ/ExbB proton channel family protein [Arenicella chitinivorans]GHA00298.1 biopolymer transporter ExbB [Arenicella chitinivorans]